MNEANRLNIGLVKCYDSSCVDVLDSSASSHFYTFDDNNSVWKQSKIGGTFLLYKRDVEPFYGFIIVNRKIIGSNHVEQLTPDIKIQNGSPFLLYKNNSGEIFSVWFHSQEECNRIFKRMEKLHSHEGNGVSMSGKPYNQAMMNIEQAPASGPPLSQKFFANKATRPSKPAPVTNPDFKQLLLKAEAKYNQQKSVESEVEASAAKPASNAYMFEQLQKLIKPNGRNGNFIADSYSSGEEFAFGSMPKYAQTKKIQRAELTEEDAGDISDDEDEDPAILNLEADFGYTAINSGTKPSPMKDTLLITPAMFASVKDNNNKATPCISPAKSTATVSNGHSNNNKTGLTKEQLKDALINLIDNDDEFIDRIHQSYLQTLRR